tara:strand:- start:270 stop:509 length:240 start_codon:yes stop_codon:yes gene_type:complete
MIEYEEWLINIKENKEELKKFIYELYGETKLNYDEKETRDYLYNCLKKSEKARNYYTFNKVPTILLWARSHERIMKFSS